MFPTRVRVGSMNSPFLPLADEIGRIARAGFEFVDLTLEPPEAWPVRPDEVQRLVASAGLDVVGHTAYYLPIASPFPELRVAARELMVQAFEIFAVSGNPLVDFVVVRGGNAQKTDSPL